jgi:hypothetical protein
MTHGEGPPWKGKSEGDDASLQAAIECVGKAKGQHAPAGWYAVSDIRSRPATRSTPTSSRSPTGDNRVRAPQPAMSARA